MKWIASGATTVEALAGHTRRKQPSFGAGTTSGLAGRVKATWQPHGKLTWNAAVWRDFAPLESTVVSYTLNKGASAGVQWDASAKVKVNADLVGERRNYNPRDGAGATAQFANSGDLRDSIRTGSLRATWSPRPTVQVVAGLAHQARSGSVTLGTGSFKSNSMTLSATVQF